MLRIALPALLSILASAASAPAAFADDALATAHATPPRLSLVNGPVSFWRPGNRAWENAALNTPLAEGDILATSEHANAEVQVGAHAWVRAANATEISITANRPQVTAITLTAGVASVDARSMAAGHALDIITPHATVAIGLPGYYRIVANADTTRLSVRRGGNAQLRSPAGHLWRVQAGEEALLDRTDPAALRLFALPAEDAWDRWNLSRGDWLGNSIGARHVAPEVYGLAELDRYGSWRHDSVYGPVWIPAALPAGWAPYSAGRWIDDPVYGPTWIDDAPWGYAPFHYGRWISVGSTWAWAPGPRPSRTVYAPALVGWIGDPGARSGWVALGWGEPVLPWWGPATFVGRPHWGGWGGPRLINHAGVRNGFAARDLPAIRYVNSHHAIVRPRHDEQRFEARPHPVRPADTQTAQPHHPAPHDGRARSAAPVANLPAPMPRMAPPATPVATPTTPVAAAPTPVAVPAMPAATPAAPVTTRPVPHAAQRESPARAHDGHRERERHARQATAEMPAQPLPPQPQAPVPRAAPSMAAPPAAPATAPVAAPVQAPSNAAVAVRNERAAPAQPVQAQPMHIKPTPAPAVTTPPPFTGHPMAGSHRHERRVEVAAPVSRPAATDSTGPSQARRRDDSAPAPGAPRRDGPRPEGAERKPRP